MGKLGKWTSFEGGVVKTKLFAPVMLATIVVACATVPQSTVPLPVEATLINLTGESLARVEYRACGANSWSQLDQAPVLAGATVKFKISDQCVDLDAYYSSGKLAGSQRGVNRNYPFTWTLR